MRDGLMRRALVAALVIIFLGIGVVLWVIKGDVAKQSVAAVSGTNPVITPARSQSFPTIKVADAVGWPTGGAPTPAPGLTVKAFARGLQHPRWLYRLPNGDILVAESSAPREEGGGGIQAWVSDFLMRKAGADVPSANRITLLRDADGDGTAEGRIVLLQGLNSPYGMALLNGYLYVGNTDALVRVPFVVGQTRVDAKPERVISLPGGGHWARNVVAAPDGKTLFVAVGSSSNIADGGLAAEKNRAAIWQINPQSRTARIFATGLRNPNGLGYEPHSGKLWAVVNERDMLGSDLVPDYMTRVDRGEDYGWPWFYWGNHRDERVPLPPGLNSHPKRPDYALGPHTASLGLAFANEARLGTRFANGAFIGQHGSWNRVPVSGYKVVYVPFASNGMPEHNAKPIDVLSGFLNGQGQAQGRPVGVTIDRRGALLVADDVGNVIWRVTGS